MPPASSSSSSSSSSSTGMSSSSSSPWVSSSSSYVPPVSSSSSSSEEATISPIVLNNPGAVDVEAVTATISSAKQIIKVEVSGSPYIKSATWESSNVTSFSVETQPWGLGDEKGVKADVVFNVKFSDNSTTTTTAKVTVKKTLKSASIEAWDGLKKQAFYPTLASFFSTQNQSLLSSQGMYTSQQVLSAGALAQYSLLLDDNLFLTLKAEGAIKLNSFPQDQNTSVDYSAKMSVTLDALDLQGIPTVGQFRVGASFESLYIGITGTQTYKLGGSVTLIPDGSLKIFGVQFEPQLSGEAVLDEEFTRTGVSATVQLKGSF